MVWHLADGCINPDAYEEAPTKIIHLLKHGVTHQNPDGYTSLVKMINDGHQRKPYSLAPIWMGCARRAYCIFNGFPPWTQIAELDVKTELWPEFAKTAILNVIKETGAASTDPDKLISALAQYAPEVSQQVNTLRPDIVICGGTFAAWMAALSVPAGQFHMSQSGMQYAEVEGILYLDAYHPSHRLKHQIEYAFFRAGASETCPPYMGRIRRV